jgi:hypothetical protein
MLVKVGDGGTGSVSRCDGDDDRGNSSNNNNNNNESDEWKWMKSMREGVASQVAEPSIEGQYMGNE